MVGTWIYTCQVLRGLLTHVATFHCLPFHRPQLINGDSKVVTADVDCTNGVVHLIDTVLIPKAIKDAAAAWSADSKEVAAPEATLNIVQLAESVSTLSTLVKAVVAAGLVNTLESAGPFTVFAPLDEAFARLPTGVLDYLLQNPKVLTQVRRTS